MNASTKKALSLLVAAIHLCLFAFVAWRIGTAIHHFPIPFDTDEADHGNAAIELFFAAKSHSLAAFWHAITRQAFYPPIYSFFVSLSYFIFGPSFFSSRLPALISMIAAGGVLSASVWRVTTDKAVRTRLMGASLPLILLASSPLIIENSALCMIELFAVLVTALLFLVPMRGELSRKALLTLVLILCLSFFSKYNFGILVIAGTVGAFWLKPLFSFFQSRQEFKQSLLILALFALVFGSWFLVSIPGSIIHFFVGHPSYSPLTSSDNILFEITAWFKEYSPNYFVAALTLALGIYGAYAKRDMFPVRIAYAITGASFTILLLSTTNESRHFIVAAPCIWYLAAIGWTELVSKNVRVAALSIVLPLSIYWGFASLYPHINKIVANAMEGDVTYAELQDGIFSAIDSTKPALFIGVSDQFGIEALKWQGARFGKIQYTAVRFDSFPYRDEKNFTAYKRQRTLAAPYALEHFPKDDIHEILSRNHYHALVLIRTIGERDETSAIMKELKDRFKDSIRFQRTMGKIEVTVIALQ